MEFNELIHGKVYFVVHSDGDQKIIVFRILDLSEEISKKIISKIRQTKIKDVVFVSYIGDSAKAFQYLIEFRRKNSSIKIRKINQNSDISKVKEHLISFNIEFQIRTLHDAYMWEIFLPHLAASAERRNEIDKLITEEERINLPANGYYQVRKIRKMFCFLSSSDILKNILKLFPGANDNKLTRIGKDVLVFNPKRNEGYILGKSGATYVLISNSTPEKTIVKADNREIIILHDPVDYKIESHPLLELTNPHVRYIPPYDRLKTYGKLV
jgi:hypothetical protein